MRPLFIATVLSVQFISHAGQKQIADFLEGCDPVSLAIPSGSGRCYFFSDDGAAELRVVVLTERDVLGRVYAIDALAGKVSEQGDPSVMTRGLLGGLRSVLFVALYDEVERNGVKPAREIVLAVEGKEGIDAYLVQWLDSAFTRDEQRKLRYLPEEKRTTRQAQAIGVIEYLYQTRIERALESGTARVHTVQKGETLSSISRQYYGDSSGWKRIQTFNEDRLPDGDRIIEGERVLIPGK